MTYYSLQEIEAKYPESENDPPAKRIANRKTKNQAIKRFNENPSKVLLMQVVLLQNQICIQPVLLKDFH